MPSPRPSPTTTTHLSTPSPPPPRPLPSFPTRRSSDLAVMPRENTNRYTNPNTPLRVVATHVSTAANAGAPHGAATTPDVAPSRKTAGYDPPPRPAAHRIRR